LRIFDKNAQNMQNCCRIVGNSTRST